MVLFRSETMQRVLLIIPYDAGFETMSILGENGFCQFEDMNKDNPVFQRQFSKQLQECYEMEDKICYVVHEINYEHIKIIKYEPEAVATEFLHLESRNTETFGYFMKLYNELFEIISNSKNMFTKLEELNELKFLIITYHKTIFSLDAFKKEMANYDIEGGNTESSHIRIITGVILKQKKQSFEKSVWRLSKGNIMVKFLPIVLMFDNDLFKKANLDKESFFIIYRDDEIRKRLFKLCDGYKANLYFIPETRQARIDKVKEINVKVEDLREILQSTAYHRYRLLKEAALYADDWLTQIIKRKSVYFQLNKLLYEINDNTLIGECWVLGSRKNNLEKTLYEISVKLPQFQISPVLEKIPTLKKPPTYFRLNKVTQSFQNVINAYGIPQYKELNPTPFTIATFPILFGIMFGDMGHGILLTIFGSFLCFFEKRLSKTNRNNEIWHLIFTGRYIILLMGVASMFMGTIYNDFFSKSVTFGGTAWMQEVEPISHNELMKKIKDSVQLDIVTDFDYKTYTKSVRHYGIDPIWQYALNRIDFTNSLKMKMAITFGVLHLSFGLLLSVLNQIYFKQVHNILVIIIPQTIVFVSIFGYMVFLIFFKWTKFGPLMKDVHYQPRCAPLILITIINMVLWKTEETNMKGCTSMYPREIYFEILIMTIVLSMLPVMFVLKPIVVLSQKKLKYGLQILRYNKITKKVEHIAKRQKRKVHVSELPEHPKKTESIFEIIIREWIRTIEYILGCVSYTASYLRLWALSLAHNQLSELLWEMVMVSTWKLSLPEIPGAIVTVFIFFIWQILTIMIIVIMEGLSAFLHTLRLHWMEFQSKFFRGTGYPFEPFYFPPLLEEARSHLQK